MNKNFSTKHRLNMALSFDRLKEIVNALNQDLKNESLLKLGQKSELCLNKMDVKCALNEVFGPRANATSLANIVLDDSLRGLFSQNLIEEEAASVKCLKKIQEIIESDENCLRKPIIIVTESNEKEIKIICIVPNSETSNTLYFMCPFSGHIKYNLKTVNQTANQIFERYLKEGSLKNSLKPLKGLEMSDSVTEIKGCLRQHTGWWCLYYAIMLVYYGKDDYFKEEFSKVLSAAESFPRLVTLLSTNISFLSKLETKHTDSIQIKMKLDTNKLNINEFLTIDTQIRNEFESNTEKIQKQINDLTDGSTLERQKKLELNQKEIDSQQLKVKKEIEELERVIKQTENLLLHPNKESSAVITTESKYKKFMTGEERRQIEAKIKKKQEKAKETILENNENLKQKDIKDQIEILNDQISNKTIECEKIQDELNKLQEKKTKFQDKISSYKDDIERFKDDVRTQKSEESSNNLNLEELKKVISEINGFVLDRDAEKLINRMAQVKTYDKTQLDIINSNLKSIESQKMDLNNNLELTNTILNDKISMKADLEIKKDLKKNSIDKAKRNIQSLESSVDKAKNEFDECNSWWYRLWYSDTVKKLKNTLNEEKKKLDDEKNNLSEFERNISSFESGVLKVTVEIKSLKKKQSDIEADLRNAELQKQNHIKSLLSERDKLLNIMNADKKKFIENDHAFKKEVKSKEDMIISTNSILDNEKEDLKRIDVEIKTADLSLFASKKLLNDLKENVTRLKDELRVIHDKSNSNVVVQLKDASELVKDETTNTNRKNNMPLSNINGLKLNSNILCESKLEEELFKLCNFDDQKWLCLYKASVDGFGSEKFHSKCDNHTNTLTIIKSASLNIFGGYTGAAWSSSNDFAADPYSFIFSLKNKLDKPLLIKCNDPKTAIYCNSDYGPCFGNDDIKISSDSNSKSDSKSNLGFSYEHNDFEYGSKETKIFLAGSFKFQVDEIEVYRKDYPMLSMQQKELHAKTTKLNGENIKFAYETFHTIAINRKINLEAFINYLIKKIKLVTNEEELNEMKELFKFMFKHFDKDESGKLDFEEFLQCVSIFENMKKTKDIPVIIFEFLFEMADKDKNGFLDFVEIQELHKKFLSNYGIKKLYEFCKQQYKGRDLQKIGFTKSEGAELFNRFYKIRNAEEEDEYNEEEDEYNEEEDEYNEEEDEYNKEDDENEYDEEEQCHKDDEDEDEDDADSNF